MAHQTPVWIGSTAITECPDSPIVEYDANRFMVTRHYEGPYDAVMANQPVNGQSWQDFPAAVTITKVTITPKPGAIAHIEVYGETPGTGNSETPTYEIEWVEIDRALILNPRYLTGGAMALTSTDQAMLQKWEEEDNPVLKNAFQYKVPQDNNNPGTGSAAPTGTTTVNGVTFNVYTLSSEAQDYAAKRLQGEESYRLWAPVARQTIETYDLPSADPCGVIEAPPSAIGAPTGYTYQRSAQRATKTGRYGKWQQQQEWQGFDYIDPDLYPSS
jgi:hypothetical protein